MAGCRMSTPWWFSGDEATREQERPAFDFSALGATAQALFDLARNVLVAPHATHADPAEHPDCLLCRASSVVGDGPKPVRDVVAPEWIAISRAGDAPNA